MSSLRVVLASTVFFLVTQIGAQTGETAKITANNYKFFSSNEEIKKVVGDIGKIIAENKVTVAREGSDGVYHLWGTVKNFQVFDDRIEFSKGKPLVVMFFKDIIKNFTYGKDYHGNIRIYIGNKPDRYDIFIKKEGGHQLLDNLKLLKKLNDGLNAKMILEEQDSILKSFEPVAAQYRELKVKPPISEEQRRFIVQANSFNQKKDYTKAIELYLKAVEIDRTAYPAAYSNLALLSAQVGKFSIAIFYMKKYLLLEPEGPDSRGARDKIYEWEAELNKE